MSIELGKKGSLVQGAMNGKVLQEVWLNGKRIYPALNVPDLEYGFNGNLSDSSGHGKNIDTYDGTLNFASGFDGKKCIASGNNLALHLDKDYCYDPKKICVSMLIMVDKMSTANTNLPIFGGGRKSSSVAGNYLVINFFIAVLTFYTYYNNGLNSMAGAANNLFNYGKWNHLLFYVDITNKNVCMYVNGARAPIQEAIESAYIINYPSDVCIYKIGTGICKAGVGLQDFSLWKGDNLQTEEFMVNELWDNKYKDKILAQ